MIVNLLAYNRWAEQQVKPIVQIYMDLANTFESILHRDDLTMEKTLSLIQEAWASYDSQMKEIEDAVTWLWHPDVISCRCLMQEVYEQLLVKWDL